MTGPEQRGGAPRRPAGARRFTLSRDQALARHRASTLPHPAWYVLELVQAAVFAGADYLAIEAGPATLRVAWVGGRTATLRELEQLFDHLFVDPTDPRRRHLVHLALGLNGLLRRGPLRVRLEAGDGRRAVRLDVDRRGRLRVGPADTPVEGTRLVARFRDAWLRRIGGDAWSEEQGLVEERCQYAPVPILLDGEAPFGYRGDAPIEIFGAAHQRPFARDGRRGVIALPERGQIHAGFRIVVGGVWVATLPLRGLAPRPLIGVVCDDRLRRTPDGSTIARDDRFHELLRFLREEATALMRSVEGPGYEPPARSLDPLPERPSGEIEAAVPLPRRLRALSPRPPLPLTALPRDGEPLLWCAPEDVARLTEPADPARLPCPVVVLRPAERRALRRGHPDLPLWQLRDTTDVGFAVRYHASIGRIRERRFEHEDGRVTLRVHLEGPLPSWGEGLPFVVVRDGATVLTGGVQGDRVVPTAARGPRRAPWNLACAFHLPRVSLVIEGPLSPDEGLLRRVVAEAARLVHALDEPPPADLLAALLACFVPRFEGHPARLRADPPPGAPPGLADRPLLAPHPGAPTLHDLLAALGTEAVLPVDTAERLAALAPVERRFGWGHLGHPSLDGRPVWAVGRIGGRWSWLDRPELLRAPTLEQIVQVGANLAPPQRDGWVIVDRPHPAVAAMRREDRPGGDWARGVELLVVRLRRAALDDGWPVPLIPVDPDRARALGRLALLALAARERPGDLMLRPTDGGPHRSLADLGADPAMRAVPRGGVDVEDPHTVALTADELRAVVPAAPLRAREHRALTLDDADDAGWLARIDVHGPGLRGVLGLEHPFEGASSALVRTAGGLRALRGLPLVPGRHALLEPIVARMPREADLRLLTLELARASMLLHDLLDDARLDPGRAESARLHALATALTAWRRGHLSGPMRALAQRAPVRDALGGHWGSLADWLEAPRRARPPLPPAVAHLAGDVEPPLPAPVHARVAEIVGDAGLKVRLSWIHDGRGPPVRVSEERSSPTRVVLLLDRAHPAVARAAVEAGREREVVLLECARRLTAWGRTRGLDLDLPTMQRLLLARRLDEPTAPRPAGPGAQGPARPSALAWARAGREG